MYDLVAEELILADLGGAKKAEMIRAVGFVRRVEVASGGVRQKAGVIPWLMSQVATSCTDRA